MSVKSIFKPISKARKLLLAASAMLLSVTSFAQFPAPYCAVGFSNNVEPITLVQFAGINNSSPNTVGAQASVPPLQDFTAVNGYVIAGVTYPIKLKGNTDGNFVTYLRVYADWNQNNTFGDVPNEIYDIGTITNSTGLDAVELNGTIAVPAGATAGNTRMRVIKKYNAHVADPCNSIGTGWGQAEDYTLTVTIPAVFPNPYCTVGFSNNVEPITLVEFAGINNTTSNTVGAQTTVPPLENFTGMVGTVMKGNTYPIKLKGNTDGNFTTNLRVYVDWNQNTTLGDVPNEIYDIGTITNSTGIDAVELLGTITVPLTAATGNARMRVIKKYNGYVADACNSVGTGFGQAEDYTLSVMPPPPCATPGAQPTALVLAPAAISISGTFTAPTPAPDGYLVVRTPGAAALSTPPVNGTTYTAAGTLGNGTIVGMFTTPSFTDNGLPNFTNYTYTIFAVNSLCSGGPIYRTATPLTGNTTTTGPIAYTWNATTGTADATLPASWTPARTAPDVTDTLYFSNGGSSTATNLVTSAVAKIVVRNNTSVTTNAATAATITINRELRIEAGSTLDIGGTVNTTLNFSATNAPQTSTIAGTLKLSGTATTTNYTATNSITTVTGTIDNSATNGAFTSTAANLLFNAGSTYTHNRNGGTNPTATWSPTSTYNMTGIVGTGLIPPTKIGHLIWNCPAQTVNYSWSSSMDSILGNFTMVSTGTGRVEGGNTPNIQIMGNFTQTGGTFALGNYTSTVGLVEVFGTTSLQGGTLLMSSGASGTASYTLFAFGNFTQAAGHTINKLNALAAAPATVTFAGTTAKTVNVAGTVTSNINFTLNNPAGAALTGIIPINQDATNTMTAGAWSGTGSFTYNSTASTLAYNGLNAQTAAVFEYPAASGPTNLTIAKGTGSAVTLPFSRTVPGTLTLTSGDISLGANTLTLGTSAAAPGTMAGTGGLIRVSTGSFVRWYGTTGLPTAAGTGIGYYPMANAGGSNRAVSLYFDAATALTTGGTIAVSHNGASGVTGSLSIADGAYTINNRTNGSWSFATGNGIVMGGANNVGMRITGADMFTTSNVANLRVMQPTAVVGTHVAGTGTAPAYQASRTGLTLANLTATALHIGASNADMLGIFTAINTGNWGTASTWDVNAVPTITDITIIAPGVNVTASASSVAKSLTIQGGGTLTVGGNSLTIDGPLVNGGTINTTGGTLTINDVLTNNGTITASGGTTTVNSTSGTTGFVNNGTTTISGTGTVTVGPAGGGNKAFTHNNTFTISGGTLNVNGNINAIAGSSFTQSGGTIRVDGNAAGVAANSVASGTSIVSFKSQLLSLTGGNLILVDPHANSSASNTFEYNNSTAHVNAAPAHTLTIGDGVSTDAGGNATNGFRLTTWPGSSRIAFGNIVVDAGTGTNRFVTHTYSFGILGNLTINSGEFRLGVITYVAGNVVVNSPGIFTADNTLYMGSFPSGVAGPVTVAQTISGNGTFRNLAAAPTANFTGVQVNNSSAGGVTFANNASYSGALTFTLGKVFMGTNTMIQIAGATIAGNSATTGWVVGKFQKNATVGGLSHFFPIGDANAYTPVNVTGAAGAVTTAGDIIISTTTGDHPNIATAHINPARSVNRYYTVALANGIAFAPGALTMNVTWVPTDVDAGSNTAIFVSSKYTGSAWVNQTVSTPLATSINITGLGAAFPGAYQVGQHMFPLAIKLQDIAAANVGDRNRVDWSTATEAKGDVFELQRSADGDAFEKIADVDAKGTASSYTHWDEQPIQGMNYYRLKMIDAGGQFSYSAIVKAMVKTAGTFVVDAYPNPVTDRLTVKANGNTGNAQLIVTDISGKLVRSQTMYGDKAEIDMSGLQSGIYFVKYADQQHTETVKINKQ